jgi:hypothetical protein
MHLAVRPLEGFRPTLRCDKAGAGRSSCSEPEPRPRMAAGVSTALHDVNSAVPVSRTLATCISGCLFARAIPCAGNPHLAPRLATGAKVTSAPCWFLMPVS